jgi:hypothetical protein
MPAAAAEFPNDNPLLHRGARWVCRDTRGPARAMLRPQDEGAPPPRAESPPLAAPMERAPATEAPSPRPQRRYDGPLVLELDRIVIPHRVEDVPPPPDFIFRPFVRAAAPTAPVAVTLDAAPIQPRACQVVDAREARLRVQRTGRVDIAPCLSVVESAPAAPAPVVERVRRSRRRGPPALRALAVAPLPDRGELQRAIEELEAAFAKPGLHCRPHEGARVSQYAVSQGPCPAGAV